MSGFSDKTAQVEVRSGGELRHAVDAEVGVHELHDVAAHVESESKI